jgi:hypothetical protein
LQATAQMHPGAVAKLNRDRIRQIDENLARAGNDDRLGLRRLRLRLWRRLVYRLVTNQGSNNVAPRAVAGRDEHQSAGNRVGNVIMRAGRMIDDISPGAATNAPLQATELRDKPGIVEQLDPAAVQQRQQLAVKIALRFL